MILLTGAGGFLGRYVLKELLKSKNKVRCIDIKRSVTTNKNVKIMIGDIRDKELVDDSMKGVNYVVHLASALNRYKVKELYSVNVEGTRNLVEAAKKYGVKKFIFVSSEGAIQRFDEYGESKARAEEVVRQFRNHVILRPTLIYGKGDRKNIAKLIKVIKRLPFVPIMGDGKNKLQPVYVGDVASAIKNSLFRGKGTYIVAGNEQLSLEEIVGIIESCLDVKRHRVRISKTILRALVVIMNVSRGIIITPKTMSPNIIEYFSKDQIYDVSKTMRDLNYTPISFREGVKKSI